MSDADVKLDVGRELTRGLGAGADPEVGKKAAEDHAEEIEEVLAAPTWSSSPPARAAARAPVARPSWPASPGSRCPDHRRRHAPLHLRGSPSRQPGRDRHRPAARRGRHPHRHPERPPAVHQRPGVSMLDAFRSADQVLLSGVQGITDLITTPGLINLDFADVKSVMQGAGSALMGIGSARGEDRAVQAAELAISSPLLEASIDGAHGVLLSIQGGSDLGLFEINEAARLVQEAGTPRPTSSSVPSSTTPSATRCASRSSRPGSTAGLRCGAPTTGRSARCRDVRPRGRGPGGSARRAASARGPGRDRPAGGRRHDRAGPGSGRAGPSGAARAGAAAHGDLRRERRSRRA
jgi:cell division protein FtsZ